MSIKEPNILNLNRISFNQQGCLFYPSAGDDLLLPLSLFKGTIDCFWFADLWYFTRDNYNLNFHIPLAQRASYRGLLPQSYHLEYTGVLERSCDSDVEPYVFTETYQTPHKSFRIHRRRGYGVSALRLDVPSISVFFYRGDSEGESGSGSPWLNSRLFVKVLAKLHDQGLIITDGSQTCGSRQYAPFAQFHRNPPSWQVLNNFLESKPRFYDAWGNRFDCLGYVGMRYGPTLVWQFHESMEFKTVKYEIVERMGEEYWMNHESLKASVRQLAKKLRKQTIKLSKQNKKS